jgi:uncharacterized protein
VPFALAVGLFVALHNNVLALARVPDRLYVPVNLAVGVALVAAALAWGLSSEEIGLGAEGVGPGLVWGGTIAAVVMTTAGVALRIPRLRLLFADRRLEALGGRGLAWRALVRMPLGTSAFEEVAFRGVLFAALVEQASVGWAVAVSSVLFGLSHVGPALAMVRANPDRVTPAVGVTLTVAATTVAGVGFSLLRIATGGIVGPLLVHWSVNASGAVGGWLALRRLAA